jgi:hypothetical protein
MKPKTKSSTLITSPIISNENNLDEPQDTEIAIINFIKRFQFKEDTIGAGEMAQQLKALTALLKVLSSNPSNHMMADNHLYSYSVLIYIK